MTAMATYYKPSQWRGKRLVYQSIDPNETKNEVLKLVRFLLGAVLWAGSVWLLYRWVK